MKRGVMAKNMNFLGLIRSKDKKIGSSQEICTIGAAAEDKGFRTGVTVLGLTSWASLSLLFMIVRSWMAANWDWVAILSGLLCFSAALAICGWKSVALDDGERGDEDGAC